MYVYVCIYEYICIYMFIFVFSLHCDYFYSKLFLGRSKWENSYELFCFFAATCLTLRVWGKGKQTSNVNKSIGRGDGSSFASWYYWSFQKVMEAVLASSGEAMNGRGTPQILPPSLYTSNRAKMYLWVQKWEFCKLPSAPLNFQGHHPLGTPSSTGLK